MILPAYIPAWFENNFFDIERLLMHVFGQLAPDVTFGCWKPDLWVDGQGDVPAVWFFKLPGAVVDWERNRENHLIQAVAVTDDPDASKGLAGFVRGILMSLSDGAKVTGEDGDTAQFWGAEERSAPYMLSPEQQFDARVVPATFCVTTNLRSNKRYTDMVRALRA